MDNFFENINTLQELKNTYRRLCKKYHPDANRNIDTTEIMKKINEIYSKLHLEFEQNQNKNRTNKKTDADINKDIEMFKDIISKTINIPTIEVEICGYWIWVTIDKKYKDILKDLNLGFKWCRNKSMWSWHDASSINEIRNKYGSEKVYKNNERELLYS